jgi:MraZ protein
MLSGCFIHSVDEKCRISLPARLRRSLPGSLVLTKGPDGCLWALSHDQWRSVIDRGDLSALAERFFIASAYECAPGDKGRFLLPDELRRHAEIRPGEEVAIVGMRNRIEIWSARRWHAANSQVTADQLRDNLPELFA